MKSAVRIKSLTICLVLLFAMTAGTVTASETSKVTGAITLDDSGDPIITVSGRTYILDGDVQDYVGREAVVTGVIEVGEDGLNYLVVDTVEDAS